MISKEEKQKMKYKKICKHSFISRAVTDLNFKKRQDKLLVNKAVEKIWQIVRASDE